MKSSAKKVELASVDDLFSTEESRADAQREKVLEIPLSELHPFKDHPFKVKDDEAMMETADSIRQYGVLVPAIARPDPNGGYELGAGHRRHRASELAGKETMPVIVRNLDDDQATIIMVDSNLQRESLLPSERAFAYKMKLEAIKHQGERSDLTSRQVGEKSQTSISLVADQAGESQRQVQRYIRLTELIPELLDMVDEKKIAFNPAYELSFLKKEEQVDLLDAMDSEQATPSLSQAQRLKKYSQEGHLTLDMMRVIMGEEKKSDLDKITFTSDTLRKYFPKSYTPARMQETIIKLLEQWQRKRQQQRQTGGQRHVVGRALGGGAARRAEEAEQLHGVQAVLLQLTDQITAVDKERDGAGGNKKREKIPRAQPHGQQRGLDPGQQPRGAESLPQAQKAKQNQQQRRQFTGEQMALHHGRHAQCHRQPIPEAGPVAGVDAVQTQQHEREKRHGRELADGGAGVDAGQPIGGQRVEQCPQQTQPAAGRDFGKAEIGDQAGRQRDRKEVDLVAGAQRQRRTFK